MEPSPIYIDPTIDTTSNSTTHIIIQFRTKPAHIHAHNQQEIQAVEKSHQVFLETVHKQLYQRDISYKIQHSYKKVFNGVSMTIRANHIHYLRHCTEIKSIFPNRKVHIPGKPNDPRHLM